MYLGVDGMIKTYKNAQEKIDRYNTLMTVLGRAHEYRQNAAKRAVDKFGKPLPEALLKQQTQILKKSEQALKQLQILLSETDYNAKLSRRTKIKFVANIQEIDRAVEEVKVWQDIYQSCFLNLISQEAIPMTVELDDVVERSKLKTEATYRAAFIKRAPNKPALKPVVAVDFSHWNQRGYTFGAILYSTARQAMVGQDPSTLRILDTNENVPVDAQTTDTDARNFAIRLRETEPRDTGLLRCEGFVRHPSSRDQNSSNGISRISFIFFQPPNTIRAMSLRQALLDHPQLPTEPIAHGLLLRDRLLMARHLVKGVYGVHLYGYVHKNVRPETILSLEEGDHADELRKDVLIAMAAKLYRHPERQERDMKYYVMQHDIYSLGVVLLEIGLWTSFVEYEADNATPLIRYQMLGIQPNAEPEDIKRRFVELSRSPELVSRTNASYASVVHNCLTCLDPDNAKFSNDSAFRDGNRVLERVKYIELIMEELDIIPLPALPT
ncbi:hypothetical protein B0T20DRAFT_485075 [Sordaria brevicollis]|uniref:Protein kinase domain-containing protein n=1 Tax=Sordaria brevicollis TaxID=83679 RepID=A0AAE0PM46_SORBR|nr:hypothetical protein B0T20DRAFT_485075 [Sordaria brevicollis]